MILSKILKKQLIACGVVDWIASPILPKLPLAMLDISRILWASVALETRDPEGERAEDTNEIIECATVEQFCTDRLELLELSPAYSYNCTILHLQSHSLSLMWKTIIYVVFYNLKN